MSRVSLSMSTAIYAFTFRGALPVGLPCTLVTRLSSESHDPIRGFAHGVGGGEVESALAQHLLALLDVGALHADDDRHRHTEVPHRGDHPLGQDVAAQDAAEDVDQ